MHEFGREASRTGTDRRVPLIIIPAALLVLALVTGVLIRGGAAARQAESPPPVSPSVPGRPAAILLAAFSSCGDVLAGLRAHAAANVGPYGMPGAGGGVVYAAGNAVASMAAGAAADGAPELSAVAGSSGRSDTSVTNVQEAGVDEPDIVKTDSGRVITVLGGVLRITDAATRKVTGSLDLTVYQGWQSAQLLVQGDQALVILGGDSGAYPMATDGRLPAGGMAATPASSALSTYLFVGLSPTPRITGSLRATGRYLDARLIGSTVRLVVHSSPAISLPVPGPNAAQNEAANVAAVRAAKLTAWLPTYSVTSGESTSTATVGCGRISHPAAYTGTSMLTVYTLDMAHLATTTPPVTVAADGDTVYATSESLYIASNPSWFCCVRPGQSKPASERTELHRFDITGSAPPRYLGSGSVPGRLLSSYSLSDYSGSLRVATTVGGAGTAAQSSSVYALSAKTLVVTGHVDGLGAGEQIYAVRFAGPLAYVVTFRQTDPLYVVDLRNPAAPRLAGSLQLTGYSDYLQEVGDGRLLGVGQQAVDGRVAGLQVSLFDVSTPTSPSLTARIIRPDAVTEQSVDPHAFLYWAPTGLVVVPDQSWNEVGSSGKVVVLAVSGRRLSEIGLLANPSGPQDDHQGIRRTLVVNGDLWTVSGAGALISNPGTLARVGWVAFT